MSGAMDLDLAAWGPGGLFWDEHHCPKQPVDDLPAFISLLRTQVNKGVWFTGPLIA